MSGLGQREVEAAKECFGMYDRGGSGRIAMDQLGTVVRSLGYTPTEKRIREIAKNDLGGKRDFTSNDLVTALQSLQREPSVTEEEIREAFRVFDRDDSGYLSAAEFRHVMTSLGEKLDDGEMDELVRELVVGPQGQVKYEELVILMANK